jgi:hypothetical protein
MPDTKRLFDLALSGLNAERARINQEIADLVSQFRRVKVTSQSKNSVTPRRSKRVGKKGGLPAAGKKALSDAPAHLEWLPSIFIMLPFTLIGEHY